MGPSVSPAVLAVMSAPAVCPLCPISPSVSQSMFGAWWCTQDSEKRKGALSRMALSSHVCHGVYALPQPPSMRVKDLQQQETTRARRWAFPCLSFPLWSSTKQEVECSRWQEGSDCPHGPGKD